MSSRADWKKKLTVFYTKYNKKMIDKIDNLLAANAGEEESMFEALVQKYTRSFFSSPPVFDPEEHIHPDITKGMCKLYMEKIRPVEEYFLFNKFQAPLMSKSDFSETHGFTSGTVQCRKDDLHQVFLEERFPWNSYRSRTDDG